MRVQKPAAQAPSAGASGVRSPASAQAAGRTIYAAFGFSCTGPGTGTQASPYCSMQKAVDSAQPGDTIDVLTLRGYSSDESVTVRTSGISIVGIGYQAWISPIYGDVGKPALVLDHVNNVTISNMMLTSNPFEYGSSPAVKLIGSTGVTIDSSLISSGSNVTKSVDALTIDGASSNVTVTRSYLDTGFSRAKGRGIAVAQGASNVTLAGNILADSGIAATGVSALNVTANTIQRGCGPAVDVEGASTGVHLENNLLEDANPNTDYMGVYRDNCLSYGLGWDPDLVVSAGSSGDTIADYNDFFVFGSDATPLYSWAGAAYPTLAAFQSATTQGGHDTIDTKEAKQPQLRMNGSGSVDARLQVGSAAIGSANPAAPGMLTSDFYGVAPFTSRGAVQFDPNPGFAVALLAQDTSAYGVSLSPRVTSEGQMLAFTLDWGDGTTLDGYNASDVGWGLPPHVYPKLGQYRISLTLTDLSGNIVSNSVLVGTAGSQYTPYGPTRLLDTRDGGTMPRVGGWSTTRLKIAGNGAIPAAVSAAVLNVTVTNPRSAGHVTVYGDGDPRPGTSNLNYAPGQTVPNMVVVPVGADGYVDLYNAGEPLDLVVDITGYFTWNQSSGYTPVSPTRLVDTRSGTGAPMARVGAVQSIPVQIAGGAGGQLPGSGITAVALNVTVTNPGDSGHLTVYPDGQQAPTASNLNFTAGQTVANSVVVPVGSDGRIRVLNGAWAPSDVIVDVVGYYSADSKGAYVPVAPDRLLDTRASTQWKGGPLGGWQYVYMPLSAGRPDLIGFVLNATVTDTTAPGHLSTAPDLNSLGQYQSGTASPQPPPPVSSLNWTAGATVPNLVQTTGGANGIIDLWNASEGTTDFVVDLFGFYQND